MALMYDGLKNKMANSKCIKYMIRATYMIRAIGRCLIQDVFRPSLQNKNP